MIHSISILIFSKGKSIDVIGNRLVALEENRLADYLQQRIQKQVKNC